MTFLFVLFFWTVLMVAADLIGMGMTVNGRRVEVGFGSYLFAFLANAAIATGLALVLL